MRKIDKLEKVINYWNGFNGKHIHHQAVRLILEVIETLKKEKVLCDEVVEFLGYLSKQDNITAKRLLEKLKRGN